MSNFTSTHGLLIVNNYYCIIIIIGYINNPLSMCTCAITHNKIIISVLYAFIFAHIQINVWNITQLRFKELLLKNTLIFNTNC